MEPSVFLAALLIFVGIPALTVIKLARLRAARPNHRQMSSLRGSRQLRVASKIFNKSSLKRRSVSILQSVCSARHGKSGGLAAKGDDPA